MTVHPVLVIHTTEGDSIASALATMSKTGDKSHEVFDPATGERAYPVPWARFATALKNLPGGVETNNRPFTYQMEIVGRAASIRTKPAGWWQALADEVRSICSARGVPLVFPCRFMAYSPVPPSSYGANNGVRLSPAAWLTVEGVIGHQHVPENVHGDPGDISPMIALITNPNNQEEDMPGIWQLGPALSSLDEVYLAHRGSLPKPEERSIWRGDFDRKLAARVDLQDTFRWIEMTLDNEAK